MQSVQSSLEDQEVDLTGLIESIVDSDEEEDLAESLNVRTSCLLGGIIFIQQNVFYEKL